MPVTIKNSITNRLLDENSRGLGLFVDSVDEEFLSAFCELLDCAEGRGGDPIILLPDGPTIVH